MRITTRGELHWVMQERRWSGAGTLPEGYERANLSGADFERANLSRVQLLDSANLSGAQLDSANLSGALLSRANLSEANLNDTNLSGAHLDGANLSGAQLDSANLSGAQLLDANLSGAFLQRANLSGANLRRARMDATTVLLRARLDDDTRLADVVWNGVPLTRLNWPEVSVLGEERKARQAKDSIGERKDRTTRLEEYADAVLASRQVATVLRGQGLNEHADRFAFRAQVLQRQVLRRQGKLGRAFGSWLLDVVSGYGYNPIRSVITYLLVVAAFAAGYFVLGGMHGQSLSWNEAVVVSMTAFHGRGFFGSAFQPGDPQAAVAAAEALIGLLIEITFIATFTQRFFAR